LVGKKKIAAASLNFPSEPSNKEANNSLHVLEQILVCFVVGCINVSGVVLVSFSSQPERSQDPERHDGGQKTGTMHKVLMVIRKL